MAFAAELKKDFQRLVAKEMLSQAYIFFGESQGASLAVARSLAHYLEYRTWAEEGDMCIDAHVVDARAHSGIDAARSIARFLWQTPIASPRRTLIVHNADAMTILAQQAILKITEEPPAHSLLLFTMLHPDAFLPALASRFQKVYVSDLLARSELKEELVLARQFLRAGYKERKDMIKAVVEEGDVHIARLVKGLLAELSVDPFKNNGVLKRLLYRWRRMQEYTVNRRLQLEAALL